MNKAVHDLFSKAGLTSNLEPPSTKVLGQLSSGWFVLARYLHDFVKHSPRYKRQLDGTLPSKAAGIWRKQLMDRVMVMLVRGWGKHLHEVGYCLADGRVSV